MLKEVNMRQAYSEGANPLEQQQIKELSQKGWSEIKIADKLRIKPKVVKNFMVKPATLKKTAE